MSKLVINIAGLGTVGQGVIKILESKFADTIKINKIHARTKNKQREININNYSWADDINDIATDCDCVVELIGGTDSAYNLAKAALSAGKHFVTANKAMIAEHGVQLAALAEANNAILAFEASVAGGIPIIKAVRECLVGNNISQISGILNGTCNYILTEIERTGADFADILKDAQDKGYAEADPTFDIEGIDASHKLAILTALAFGVKPSLTTLTTYGITNITYKDIQYAAELGYKIRLLGVTSKNDNLVSQAVYPCLVPVSHPLAAINGADNAVTVVAEPLGPTTYIGAGAGQGPTASAVVADIIDIAQERGSDAFGIPEDKLVDGSFANFADTSHNYYIRLTTADETGVLANITNVLQANSISVEEILQPKADGNAEVVIITSKVNEVIMQDTITKLNNMDTILADVQIIRLV